MNFKKIISLLIVAASVVCFAVSCNGNGDPCNHTDADNNGVCDDCTEALPTVTYTVTVKDDGNQPVSGVKVGLDITGVADVAYATTDNSGKATFSVDTDKTNRRIEAFIEDYDEKYKLGEDDAYTFASGEKSCTLSLVELDAYYVYAKDSSGSGIAGVEIQACEPEINGNPGMCISGKKTDSDGCIVFYTDKALGYLTVVSVPNGYAMPDNVKQDIESFETVVIIPSAN